MPSLANGPEPRAREAHPAGYAYDARFPALRRYAETKGGAVYLADVSDGSYVIVDESMLAEFLDDDHPAIAVYAFDTVADRDAYCDQRFSRLRTGVASDERPALTAITSGGQPSPQQMPNHHRDVRVSYKRHPVADFADLLHAYGDAALDAPTRSTVPLLAWWRAWDVALAALGDAIGQPPTGPATLAFEYPVPVQGEGRGPASQTDLLVSTPTHAIAIEAKATEPAYDTVGAWLAGHDEDSNRARVLRGWLGLIHRVAGVALTPRDVADITYQLIHRTASVCNTPAEWRGVVYQGFALKASKHAEYVAQIRRWYALLGQPSQLRFFVLDCPLRPTAAYADLRTRWAAGERKLSVAVRDGLLRGELLERSPCAVTRA